MTNKSVKTWRVFLFGLGCILAGIYLRIALTYFRVIRGNLLSNSIDPAGIYVLPVRFVG